MAELPVEEETVCEDGALCVCTVSHEAKSQKRKFNIQEPQILATKRRCSQRLSSENRQKEQNKTSIVNGSVSDISRRVNVMYMYSNECPEAEIESCTDDLGKLENATDANTDNEDLTGSDQERLGSGQKLKTKSSSNSLPDLVLEVGDTKRLLRKKKQKNNFKSRLKTSVDKGYSVVNKKRDPMKVMKKRNSFSTRLKMSLAALEDSNSDVDDVSKIAQNAACNKTKKNSRQLKRARSGSTGKTTSIDPEMTCANVFSHMTENNCISYSNCKIFGNESIKTVGSNQRTEPKNMPQVSITQGKTHARTQSVKDGKPSTSEKQMTSKSVRAKSRHCKQALNLESPTDNCFSNKRNTDKTRVIEKLKSQVYSERSKRRKQKDRLSESLTESKKVSNKRGCERLNVSLPEFNSIGAESDSKTVGDIDCVTNDLTDVERNITESVSFDSNVAKDECDDSDDDLPEYLTPIKIEKYFQKKDIVWVKWKKGPYLPAMVKNVYKKKKRMTCLIFAPEDKPEKPFPVSTTSGKVWSYFDKDKKEEILKESENLKPEDSKYFKECMTRVDTYLTKKALGQIKDEDDFAFVNQEDYSDGELVDNDTEAEDKLTEGTAEVDPEMQTNKSGILREKKKDKRAVRHCELSKKGQIRKEKIRRKTQKFVDFLLSSPCKEYLQSLFLEKTTSERHKIFLSGSVKEKAKLKHQGYGPIDDEDQIMTVLTTFSGWLKEVNKNRCLNDHAYIMDVWAPEAIVFAYQKYFTYTRKRAWELFFKGPRRTKEELILEQNIFFEQMKNLSPEKKHRMREREEEKLCAAGMEPLRLEYNMKNLVP